MWIALLILLLMGGTAFVGGMAGVQASNSAKAYGLLAIAGAILLSAIIRELNRKL